MGISPESYFQRLRLNTRNVRIWYLVAQNIHEFPTFILLHSSHFIYGPVEFSKVLDAIVGDLEHPAIIDLTVVTA